MDYDTQLLCREPINVVMSASSEVRRSLFWKTINVNLPFENVFGCCLIKITDKKSRWNLPRYITRQQFTKCVRLFVIIKRQYSENEKDSDSQ